MLERILAKLFRGECSPKEIDTLFSLLRESNYAPSDAQLKKIWEAAQHFDGPEDQLRDQIFQRIESTIQDSSVAPSTQNSVQVTSLPGWWRWVAAAVIIVGISVFIFWTPDAKSLVVQTEFGEQRFIEFLDGSHLKLNANSRVTYASDQSWLKGEKRTVFLEGEAYFEVEKQVGSSQAFEVHTKHALVEVLGTAFNVHSKAEEVQVYLEHGSVHLHLTTLDTLVVMEPGDLVTYREQEDELIIRRNETGGHHTSWKDGVLIFKDVPLREVITKIEQIYGIKFLVRDHENYQRKLEFPMPVDSLETAISILDKTLFDLEISKQGSEFIVH